MTRILILVEGGVVRNVMSDGPAQVWVRDLDSLEQGEETVEHIPSRDMDVIIEKEMVLAAHPELNIGVSHGNQ